MESPATLRENNEADLSAQQSTPKEDSRFSRPHGDRDRPHGAQTPTRQRSQAADGFDPRQAARVKQGKPDQRFPKSRRIRTRPEFLRIQGKGRRLAKHNFVVIASPPITGQSRLGITASRKIGNAVTRNRVKRLVREFFRRHQQLISPPRDIVVIARDSSAHMSYAEIAAELASALRIERALPC